jgi:hypothetical protein
MELYERCLDLFFKVKNYSIENFVTSHIILPQINDFGFFSAVLTSLNEV